MYHGIAVRHKKNQVNRRVSTLTRPSSHLHTSVDDAAALTGGEHDHRIQVELDDLWNLLGQPRHAEDDFREGLDVRARTTALTVEQGDAAHLVQELVGVTIGQRRDPEVDVAERLDVDAAKADADERAEQSIVG